MNYDEMTVEELNACCDDYDRQIQDIAQKKKELHAVRCAKVAAENAAYHGFSVEEYNTIKEGAKAEGVPFAKALAKSRRNKARGVQVATASAAGLGVKGHKS